MYLDAMIPGYNLAAQALAANTDKLAIRDLDAVALRYVRAQKKTPTLSAVVAHLEAHIAGPAPALDAPSRAMPDLPLTPRAAAHLERELGAAGYAAFRARFGDVLPSVEQLTAFFKEQGKLSAARGSGSDADRFEAMDRVMGLAPPRSSVYRDADGSMVFGAFASTDEARAVAKNGPGTPPPSRSSAHDARRIEGMDRVMGLERDSPVRRTSDGGVVFGALSHQQARELAQKGIDR